MFQRQKWVTWIWIPLVIVAIGYAAYVMVGMQGGSEDSSYEKASVLIKQGKLDEAQRVLEKGKILHPQDGRLDFALGNIARAKNQMSEALISYKEAIRKSPQFPESYNNAVGMLMVEKRNKEALDLVNQGLLQHKDSKELQFKKAQLLYVEASYVEALELLQPLSALEEYVDAYRFIGLSQLQVGRRDAAREALEVYLAKAPATAQGRAEVEKLVSDLKNQ